MYRILSIDFDRDEEANVIATYISDLSQARAIKERREDAQPTEYVWIEDYSGFVYFNGVA